ncbi:MAG: type I phosphomannose isomerase catalytic subunit [Cyclobacteriaceae bacterium]
MTKLYPLKFRTIFKDKIWGGEKIKTILGKDFAPLPNCGETWEISGVEGNISEVAEGPLAGKNLKELIQQYQAELVGGSVYKKFGDEFPLLVKFIDANDDLSIQVHPDDALAKQRHNSFGKTEMWYIFQADKGAKLISGFNQPMSREKYLEAFESGRLTDILNEEPVQAGDVFFLPAGRVHTIGKGLLLAEIQQTSDITDRIYDFDRTDAQGNKRELHVEQALDAIDYQQYDEYKTRYEARQNEPVKLAACPYFETYRLDFTRSTKRNYQGLDSFVIYVCMEGKAEIVAEGKVYPMRKGDAYLIPASITQVQLTTDRGFNMLESFVPHL